jgi:membrane protease subunit (stomatin/prohibitin family)
VLSGSMPTASTTSSTSATRGLDIMDGSVRGMAAAGVGVSLVSLGLQEVQEDISATRARQRQEVQVQVQDLVRACGRWPGARAAACRWCTSGRTVTLCEGLQNCSMDLISLLPQ